MCGRCVGEDQRPVGTAATAATAVRISLAMDSAAR